MSNEAGVPALPNLAGQTVVITGASDGIGKVAAQRLAAMGAHVVLVGRNAGKTQAVAQWIERGNVAGGASVEIADLSLQRDVHDLATRLLARLSRIDVLVNNAGAIFSHRELTTEGLERT